MRKIKLTRGKFALVDDEDYDRVSKFKWHACKPHKTWYAATKQTLKPRTKQVNIRMHRFILKMRASNILVDHKDHNGLNNQKYNLRKATTSQNCAHVCKSRIWGLSKYLGVSWHKYDKRWRACIKKNNKAYDLGRFKTQREAARAYDRAAIKLHKEFATLNFLP